MRHSIPSTFAIAGMLTFLSAAAQTETIEILEEGF